MARIFSSCSDVQRRVRFLGASAFTLGWDEEHEDGDEHPEREALAALQLVDQAQAAGALLLHGFSLVVGTRILSEIGP